MKKIIKIIITVILLYGVYNIYEEENIKKYDEDLIVHYIDVGYGDSIFIELDDNKTMLIDGAEEKYSDKIIKYIDSLNYNKIDYLIATHPHADHIGSLSKIIEKYDIDKIYMTKNTTNTKTYENLLKTIDNKNMKINICKGGNNITKTDKVNINFLGPNKEYEDLNNSSCIVSLKYGNNKFLFMGDAESMAENDIVGNIKHDVIKIGHHGSDTSSSYEFLKRVKPKKAVIMVSDDNKYNHPNDSVINRLNKMDTKIYRTDKNGNIIIKSDGNKLEINTEKEIK